MEIPRPAPPRSAPEREMLEAWLDFHRMTLGAQVPWPVAHAAPQAGGPAVGVVAARARAAHGRRRTELVFVARWLMRRRHRTIAPTMPPLAPLTMSIQPMWRRPLPPGERSVTHAGPWSPLQPISTALGRDEARPGRPSVRWVLVHMN